MGSQHREPGMAVASDRVGIVDELLQSGLRVREGRLLPATEVVEREGHIAQRGKAFGPRPDVVIHPGTLVRQQHTGAALAAGDGFVVDREMAHHRHPIDVVTHRLRL